MQGFKGLLPRQVLTDEAFTPIHKKAEDHRKASQLCIDFFYQINKFFESFSAAIQKCIQQSDIENVKSSYYCLIGFVCTKLLIENKNLTENTSGSTRQLTKLCNAILQDFSKYLQLFQGNLRKYQENQIIINQLCKKYSRSHKNLLSSIEAYKVSLTDVNFIYNVQEQIKRYQACESNYKTVVSQYGAITEKSQALSQRKAKIVKNYEDFKDQFTKVIKMIGSKVIAETKNFVSYYCSTNKNIITFLAQQKYNLQKQMLQTFFHLIQDPSNIQIFNLQQLPQKHGKKSIIPLIFEHPQLIKEQYLQNYNSQMLEYLHKVEEAIENRRSQNKRVIQLFYQYFKVIQKVHILGVKQISKNFDILRKKLIQSFGPRLSSFMKSIISIFSILSGINEKLTKNNLSKLNQIQAMVNEQSNQLKLFNDEMKANIEKFIGKKQLKKIKQEQFTQQVSVVNIKSFRKQINQKAKFFKHFIQSFDAKMVKNCEKISRSYTDLIQCINQSINQFYSLCCQYQQTYFGPEQFQKNFKIYETDVDSLIEKNKSFFQQLVFHPLQGDHAKIIFDGQFAKTQDFKKLKKPVLNQNIVQKQFDGKRSQQLKMNQQSKSPGQANNGIRSRDSSPAPKRMQQNEKAQRSLSLQLTNNRKSSTKQPLVPNDQKQAKNLQFLLTRVQFKQNEQYIKSFSCALSQKIVLQGRIYITTGRICFYSGFNSNNLFFGKTFIQFPKEDITKIEKRANSIFLDNSISFTTVKGQLFFTSFFSRNQAYDLICKTFQLSLDEHVYQFDQSVVKAPELVVEMKQDDDINDSQLQGRAKLIEESLANFKYDQVLKTQIQRQNLTAYQIFRLFYSNNEIQMNRRKYQSFLIYNKQLLEHKDLDIGQWQPSLAKIMNQSNIKTNAPIKLTRKIKATVPVASSGVPFMPKTANSQQIQNLFIFSKHKWILQSEISTSGAPYTDTFKVQLRTTVSSDQAGKCEIKVGLMINFVKNTMMKSVIESKSKQQTTKASKIWHGQINKFFSQLQKSQKQEQSSHDPTQRLRQQIEQQNNQLQQLRKQNRQIRKQSQIHKQQKQKYKKIMMGLLGLNIVLIVLLIVAVV